MLHAPVFLLRLCLDLKTAIWEPNAYPGMANRWLSRFVDESLVVFRKGRGFEQRKIFRWSADKRKIEKVLPKSQVSPNLRVLIFGGSQGARGINLVVSAVIEKKPSWLAQLEIVHQTGKYDLKKFGKIQDAQKCTGI